MRAGVGALGVRSVKRKRGACADQLSIGILVTGPDAVVVVGGRAATKANVTLAAPVRTRSGQVL